MVRLLTTRCFLVQVLTQTVQSYARAERIWQSSSVIINPQTGNAPGLSLEWIESVDDVIPGKDVLRILKFWKESRWVSTVEARGWIFRIWKVDQFGSLPAETSGDLRHHKYSIVWLAYYDLCLSPRVTKCWRQKEISSFAPLVLNNNNYYWCIFPLYEYTTLWLVKKFFSTDKLIVCN